MRQGIAVGARWLVVGWSLSVVCIPLAFLLLNSFKPRLDFLATPPRILPESFTVEHYREAFGDPQVTRLFINSLTVATLTTVITVAVGVLAAYALARIGLSPRWVAAVVFLFLFVRFYPRVTTVIPFFILVRDWGLLDTPIAIVIGHLGITVPFATWLLLIVFREIPLDIEEAGIVDGAGPMRRLFSLVLPLAAPGVATAAILTAFLSWNEFLIASSVARTQASTLSIGVAGFITDRGILWGPMAALSVVMILPMAVLGLALQRYLVRGLTFGAVKG